MRTFLVFVGLAIGACGAAPQEGMASGATCPQGSTLTYTSFGKAFMDQYCVSCHASSLSGAARQGAPSDHDFDTLALVHATEAEHIDENAAAGPNAVNTEMPPAGSKAPSEEERRKLGEWLACGAP